MARSKIIEHDGIGSDSESAVQFCAGRIKYIEQIFCLLASRGIAVLGYGFVQRNRPYASRAVPNHNWRQQMGLELDPVSGPIRGGSRNVCRFQTGPERQFAGARPASPAAFHPCRVLIGFQNERARDCDAEFGPPPGGSMWRVDHPSGAVVQLADGAWHNVLGYRIHEDVESRSSEPPAQTGAYLEEVRSAGAPVAAWRF
jgi:hypothetical protein